MHNSGVCTLHLPTGHRSSIQPHCEDRVSVWAPSLSRSESRTAAAQDLVGIRQFADKVMPRPQESDFSYHDCLHYKQPGWLDRSTRGMGRPFSITHLEATITSVSGALCMTELTLTKLSDAPFKEVDGASLINFFLKIMADDIKFQHIIFHI